MATTEAKTRDSKYLGLADDLRRRIESGRLRPGDRLPTYAQLLAEYGVRQNTVEKVYAVLDREGLIERRPNYGIFVAPPRAARKTGAIGMSLSLDDPSAHPYYQQLVTAVQRAAHAAHTEVVLPPPDSYIGLEKIDGLLLCHGHCDKIVKTLPPGLPVVVMVHLSELAPCVVADEAAGMAAAMEHLLRAGHRRIAYLSVAVQSWSNAAADSRHAAYLASLRANGIAHDARWSRPVFRDWDQDLNFARAGFARTKQWIEEDWRELGCTALLAHNDDVAIGAIKAFGEAGIAVPGEVSVVGFDGSAIALASHPALTTVELPLTDIGTEATRLLLELVAADSMDAPARRIVTLPAVLRVRESTAGIT